MDIGRFPVRPSASLAGSRFAEVFPETFAAFHWHGDTFSLSTGAIPLDSIEDCANQGFIYEDRVVAVQLHLETTPQSAQALIENCGDELDASSYVQSEPGIINNTACFAAIEPILMALLDAFEYQSARS